MLEYKLIVDTRPSKFNNENKKIISLEKATNDVNV